MNKMKCFSAALVAFFLSATHLCAQDIEKEFGIPIVNKRISITPVSLVGAAACKTPEDYVTIARTLDKAAKEVGVNFIGGYSALVSKGMTKSEENLIRSIPQALAETERICSSVNVGSTKTGINMDAVRLCGHTHILCIYEKESRYKYKDPLDGSRERTASSTFKGRGKIPFFLYQRVCLERQKHIENRCANDI